MFSISRSAIALALAASFAAAPLGHAKQPAKPKVAKVAISKVAVKGAKVTVAGRVSLPANSARQRKRTRVALTLTSSARKVERFTAKIDSKRRFKATRTTRLTGTLTVSALVRIGGKQSGKRLTKRFKGPAIAKAPRQQVGPGPGGEGPDPGRPIGAPLIGTFKLDEGAFHNHGGSFSHSGSYFRMINPNGVPLSNGNSRSPIQTYTLLRPGTDGGLRTDAYQPRPSPAFDSSGVLANRIVQRELFYGAYFTIVTEPTDFKAPFTPIEPPQISHQDGRLTGQVAAWVANWNSTALFDQGTPKPDGTLPGSTTPLTGTYDAATRRFTLEWTSLITGGPFNTFGGYWHLEGTFEPAG